MNQNALENIQIRIAGEAGDGIITAAELILCCAANLGLKGRAIKNIPSTIEGGYTEAIINISKDDRELLLTKEDNILLILSKSSLKRNENRIKECKKVFIEKEIEEIFYNRDTIVNNIIFLPLRELSRQTNGSYKYLSVLILGIVGTIIGFDKEIMIFSIKKRFAQKDKNILEENIKCLEAGINWAQYNLRKIENYRLTNLIDSNKRELIIVDGNEAIAWGAVKAGCRFYASYPITPANSIGENLTEILPTFNGFVYQAEDEIAAIGAVIGSSFACVKAMTATSGPGLSLMQEFLGYASMAELPVVVVDVQRAGPSTGMPTKFAQEDLLSAIFGGHGENFRIVLSPVNIEDCFYIMLTAFYCAEYFRCPVIVLSDVFLSTTKKVLEKSTFDFNDKKEMFFYKEYLPEKEEFSKDNNSIHSSEISQTSYRITGIEHNDCFFPVDSPLERVSQVEKRHQKFINIEEKIENSYELDIDEPNKDEICISIASWGGLVSITKESVRFLREKGYKIAAFYPRLLYPICKNAIYKWSNYSKLQIVIEANSYAQYTFLLKASTGVKPYPICYYDGEIPSCFKIVEEIEHIITKNGLKNENV